MTRALPTTLAACLVLSPAVAVAQSEFGFVTLDRMDKASRLGLQLDLPILYGDELLDDVQFARFELYGQAAWQLGSSAAGLYGQLPLAHAFVFEGGDDVTTLANLELGGFYVLGGGSTDVVLRGGVSLPTAGDEGEDYRTNSMASLGRLTDSIGVGPESTWLRLSVAPIVHVARGVTLRVDGGFDVPVDSRDDWADDPFVHLNAGLGLALGRAVGLSFESVNLGNATGDGDLSERFLHTLSFGVRGLGAVQPYGALILPLDEDLRDQLFTVAVGVQGTF